MQAVPASIFGGLEVKQNQHRVFQDGEEVNLARLEYNTFTQTFEAVWNVEFDE